MEGEKYLIGLGYGGALESMGRFEWDFRCRLGIQNARNTSEEESFIQEFVDKTSPEEPVVLILDDNNTALFRTFMEVGKQAIQKDPALYVFVVVEDQNENPHVQYFLNIEQDPIDEILYPHQMVLDADGVPDGILMMIQEHLNVTFYRRDDQLMIEFHLEELPLHQEGNQ